MGNQDNKPVAAVLFDLDGTLLDTAPDLGAALNHVCHLHQRPAVPAERFTPYASHGSRGLLNLVFADDIAASQEQLLPQLRQQFLSYYHDNIATHTRPYDGIAELLAALQEADIKVAIVTNKPIALTHRLLPHYPEFAHIEVVVGGDTLPVAKPSPEPLLHAAEQLGVHAHSCLYVGDAERDIQAGVNAGMATVLAAYGYISDEDQPQRWGADYTIETPQQLLRILSVADALTQSL